MNLTVVTLLNKPVICVWGRIIFQFAVEEFFHFTCAHPFGVSYPRQSSKNSLVGKLEKEQVIIIQCHVGKVQGTI